MSGVSEQTRTTAAAGRRFPRGLEQPPGAFRFSVDALLLACFAPLPPTHTAWRMADLGTGCGVVACGLGLRSPALQGIGMERETVLAEAARRNLALLGLEQRFRILEGDLADAEALGTAARGTYDLVVANPPYRREGSGRSSPESLRQRALAGRPGTLDAFCRAAFVLLRHHGRFVCVFRAEALADLLASLRRHRLGLRRLRCVHSRPRRAAALVLAEARRDARADTVVEPPLTLYAQERGDTLHPEALVFCPWLAQK